jgi:RNA polymerase sigma-70 factor, ECF subfamily
VQVLTNGFDELFVDEYPKLVALGVSMSADREVARELAQETMIRAHDRWDEIVQYDEPGAWLRRVMSNLLIDHHRSRTAEAAAVQRLGARSPATAGAASSSTSWGELLAPLTAQQRIVATLFYADDLSIADIATTLDISAGTVKSTLSKVRNRLRRHHEAAQKARTGGAHRNAGGAS